MGYFILSESTKKELSEKQSKRDKESLKATYIIIWTIVLITIAIGVIFASIFV